MISKTEFKTANGFQLLSKYRSQIMGLAALWIFVFHSWTPIIPSHSEGYLFLFYFIELFIKEIGFCSVDIFLLLSGFGLTYAIKKGSITNFYFRRFRRIFPPFITIAIIQGCVQNWGLLEIIKTIIGYNFYANNIYTFLWYITAIATLYLFFPIYYRLFSKAENKTVFTSGVIVIWLLLTLLLQNKLRIDMFGFTNRIPVFTIGVLFGHINQTRKDIKFSISTYILLFFTLILGLYLAYQSIFLGINILVPVGDCFLPNLLIALSFPMLFAKFLEICERRLAVFGKITLSFFGFFGSFTVEMYCVQDWFPCMIPLFQEEGWSPLMINAVMIFLTISSTWVLSMIFKLLWEVIDKISKDKTNKRLETGT